MGNCLQASETDDVDLLHSDNDSISVGARNSVTSTSEGGLRNRSRSQSTETNTGPRPARSSRRQNRHGNSGNNGGNGENSRRRRSISDSALRERSDAPPPPSYEVATMQRSSVSESSASVGSVPIYHPSPGVSRQASELTEEEQIKIAQRIGLIQHLPVDIYVEGNKTVTECVICMTDFEEGDRIRFLPCMHTYHVDCIDDWLMRAFQCPSCLEPVDSALLTSYDQQQLTAFADIGSMDDGDNDGVCRSLPRQLEQLTAVTSPSYTSSQITDGRHQ